MRTALWLEGTALRSLLVSKLGGDTLHWVHAVLSHICALPFANIVQPWAPEKAGHVEESRTWNESAHVSGIPYAHPHLDGPPDPASLQDVL